MPSRTDIVNRCLWLILRPIARFCLSHSIKFQSFLETAKRAFLFEAEKEIKNLKLPTSAVRLSVMTGLQRRDVARLLGGSDEIRERISIIARVIGQWSQDKRYKDSKGRPRPLTIAGKKSEFAKLVQSISKDLDPYAVLFELERLGNVARKEDTLHLKKPEYEPRGNIEESYALLAEDADNLISSVEANIQSQEGPVNLHSRTQYDNVDPSAADKIRSWLLERGAEWHAEVRKYISRFDKDINPNREHGGVKVVFTTFSRMDDPSSGSSKETGAQEDKK